jgi:hypothetical protein
MSAQTIEGRLLCASGCAYAITGGGFDPTAAAPYYNGAGVTQPPVAFVGGVKDINACLVGVNADGVVVAFRGTLPPRFLRLRILLDWTNGFNAEPVGALGMPGQVHEGFLASLDSLWPAVSAEVKKQLSAAPAAKLFVTGHSKGGGIAPLAALRFRTEVGVTPQVVTFAAPRTGDKTFADAYNAVFNHTRYEFADDIVPHLPLGAPAQRVVVAAADRPSLRKLETLRLRISGHTAIHQLVGTDRR